jgi:hypothetical protein
MKQPDQNESATMANIWAMKKSTAMNTEMMVRLIPL